MSRVGFRGEGCRPGAARRLVEEELRVLAEHLQGQEAGGAGQVKRGDP